MVNAALIVPVPSILPKGWTRMPNELMEALGGKPDQCPAFKGPRNIAVTITGQVEQDGRRWLHLAASYRDRVPSYYDLCDVKRIFLGEDVMAYQLFPPKAEHVNLHSHCLHLWVCLDGAVTPDFTHGTGSI